ncbi:MAG TPA: class I SAM-dependent methyltransferase, partial [Steroidobacteraceae bacterium]|nr:class I SAM-dependent methyltransferase [Steroidobacteraceae bacterium]
MDLSEWLKEDAATARYYAARLAQHGDDVRSVDWGSVQSQVQRFEVLARVGDLSNATVLDVGCGLGDLYAWLSQRGIQMRYTGVDITPQMIDACRRRFPAVDFEVANLLEAKLERRDYVFASGIFYLRQTHPLDYMRAMLARLFALCDKAVAFNSLSAWSPQR